MNLPGRLRLTTLGDLLGVVYREGATGVVELTTTAGVHAGRIHRIHVAAGLVGDVEVDLPSPRLGVILVRLGWLPPSELRRLEALLEAQPGRRAGELFVSEGKVPNGAVREALRIQKKERLEALFLLPDARITFRVARPSTRRGEPLRPDQFLYGRERFRDRGGSEVRAPGRPAPSASGVRRDPVRARALGTLGLSEGAAPGDVNRAFRHLAARMHPDRFPEASTSERVELMRRFAELSAAYHALSA